MVINPVLQFIYWTSVTERTFAPLFLGFLESDFALLWYKTLHSEVAWTEENEAWLITLHKVLWCQNTIKISINKQAKQGQSFHLVCVLSGWGKIFLAYLSHGKSHMTIQLTKHIVYEVQFHYSILLYGWRRLTSPAFTCSKSSMNIPDKCVKSVES